MSKYKSRNTALSIPIQEGNNFSLRFKALSKHKPKTSLLHHLANTPMHQSDVDRIIPKTKRSQSDRPRKFDQLSVLKFRFTRLESTGVD